MTITQEQPTQAQPIPGTLYIADVSDDVWRARVQNSGPARVTNYPDRLAIDVHKSAAEQDLEGTIRALFDQLNIRGSRFAEEFEVIVTDEELVGERAAMLLTENDVSTLVMNRDGLTDCSALLADLLLSDIGSMLDKAARGHVVSQSRVCATTRMEYPPRPETGPCPPWCELPAGHDWDDELAGRAHTRGVFSGGLLRKHDRKTRLELHRLQAPPWFGQRLAQLRRLPDRHQLRGPGRRHQPPRAVAGRQRHPVGASRRGTAHAEKPGRAAVPNGSRPTVSPISRPPTARTR